MGADSTRAPDGATTLTTKPDAAIIEAWGRRSIAYALYNSLPLDDQPDHDPAKETEQLAIVDAAEEDIRAAVATTALGAEIQLWTALGHTDATGNHDDDQAANIMDLDFFLAKDEDYDWKDRLLLSAIRSLRAMRAGGAA